MKYRMYHLTMYNISEIQKSIQSYHAGMEYALKYWTDRDFQDWAQNEKTVIILNGGTSNSGKNVEKGTMEKHYEYLSEELSYKCAKFLEPDLNFCMSAIAFIVPEQVYNKETYPEFEIKTNEFSYRGDNFIEYMPEWFNKSTQYNQVISKYTQWVESIGGETNRKLRVFLKQFRLA